ncbi:MAG: hypothetical protein HWE09_14210 [Cyclobacteriaceae bacterium]|nr:hypothetical protein [Cyclobacteriaceae bacterium]
MKKLIFGMAFLGSMMLTGISVNAQEEEEEGAKTCYQRMVICNGGYTVYHCDNQLTSERCRVFEIGCNNCD